MEIKQWTLPGTTLQINKADAVRVDALFTSMFMAGGMALGQVAKITGLENYTVQNWVKRGFLVPPEKKKYTMHQLCRIISINMLKNALPMDRICGLLGYVNGKLDKEEDDIIDDATLYFLFVRLSSQAGQYHDPASWDDAMEKALADYQEPVPGAKKRIEKALRIMLTAWMASRLRQQAEQLLETL